MEVEEAIAKAKKNNQKAFNFLLDEFWDYVYGYQLKRVTNEYDAEDITIQTFSKAFDKIDKYDEKYAFKTWLITISKNIQIDLHRKEKNSINSKIIDHEDDKVYRLLDDSPSPEDKLITS